MAHERLWRCSSKEPADSNESINLVTHSYIKIMIGLRLKYCFVLISQLIIFARCFRRHLLLHFICFFSVVTSAH